MTKTTCLEQITEINLQIDSDDEVEELNSKLTYITECIAREMSRLKQYSEHVCSELHTSTSTTSFEEQELIEEQLDIFVHEYNKVKQLLKQGREIRLHKEAKEKELTNQKRFARNLLAQYGLNPSE